ncbi:MAG: hypothetical protein OXU96_02885 [Gammaproteobacteria bacterium]|nr:hypothetical protein [Gammaproteobacteria bacterium]
MSTIPEFTAAELATIREMLMQRYRNEVEIHLADSEVCLDAGGRGADPADDRGSPATVNCPTVYWHQRGANFVVVKTGATGFRTQFFYTPHEQFGTGIDEYRSLDECVAAALQTQSDHERDRDQAGASGATALTEDAG